MSVILYWQADQDIPFFPPPEREALSATTAAKLRAARGIQEAGGLVLDATIREQHKVVITYTENPIEKGGVVSDHAYIEPDEFTCDCLISDDSGELLGGGIADALTSRQKFSDDVFYYLQRLAKENVLLVVETPLKFYENMTIRELSVPKTVENFNALEVSIVFKQMQVAYSAETDVVKPVSVQNQKKIQKKKRVGKVRTTKKIVSPEEPLPWESTGNEVEEWVTS